MRTAIEITLTKDVRSTLEKYARGRSTPVRLAERASIVLMAADGVQTKDIAAAMQIPPGKAARWRNRFAKLGLVGIQKDAPRPGRKPKISQHKVGRLIKKTTSETPKDATHWSTRSMATAMDISESTVRRIWKAHGLKPHLIRTFKLSNDPHFIEKLDDIVGLYLNPPEHAVVFSADEKSQIQALDRTQPGLPMKKGRAGTMTHDYKRNGTTTLFAALNTLDGKVLSMCMARHRHQEWLKFLKLIELAVPKDKDIHIIADNYATHKHANVKRWLEKHPRIKMHFTPTSASWLNMIERFFRDITEKQIRRGVFRSVKELEETILHAIAEHNNMPAPYIWTATAKDILEKVNRGRAKLLKVQTA